MHVLDKIKNKHRPVSKHIFRLWVRFCKKHIEQLQEFWKESKSKMAFLSVHALNFVFSPIVFSDSLKSFENMIDEIGETI